MICALCLNAAKSHVAAATQPMQKQHNLTVNRPSTRRLCFEITLFSQLDAYNHQ
jgi:plasmid replication initiation protein